MKFFKKLYADLENEGLIMGVDEKQLKAKIKNLKDVYRNELAKIKKIEKVEVEQMKYILQNLRGSTLPTFFVKFYQQDTASQIWGSINDVQIDETIIGRPRPSPTKMKPPSGSSAYEKKAYDQFGKYVAYELRQLPQRHAILLQSEIQSCITRIRLSTLEPLPHQYHQQPLPYTEQLHVNVASPSTSSSSISNYTSTPRVNKEYDIISQAIINSFSDNDQ
ncbi:hypothetical protein QTP88_020436 [Uroleucon formosanum]